MAEVNKDKRENSGKSDTTQINIVGNLQLQNELFSKALAKETGLPCTYTSHDNLPDIVEKKNAKNCVVLWDCVDQGDETLWSEFPADLPREDFYVILFNVLPEQNIETQAVKRGVKGIFYRGDSLSTYKKGIQTILKGQLWFSRIVLEKCLTELGARAEEGEGEQALLTFREQQILSMVAAGLSKDDIADSLHISPHTVKTHTHNIYKKINVTSRVKATLWATRHLMYLKRRPSVIGLT